MDPGKGLDQSEHMSQIALVRTLNGSFRKTGADTRHELRTTGISKSFLCILRMMYFIDFNHFDNSEAFRQSAHGWPWKLGIHSHERKFPWWMENCGGI